MKFNLLFFVRLLVRHITLLITIPIVLAIIVFYSTKDQPQVFVSNAKVYTGIASGTTIELENTKVDYRATNTAYDNLLNLIKSRAILEKVSLKLFTQHMMLDSHNDRIISKEKYRSLMEIVPEEVKALVVKGDPLKTYENFIALKESGYDNFIYKLINLEHPDYSISKISGRIKVRRIMSSDLLEIGYESNDPGICQNTLLILTEVFVDENAEMKAYQSDSVVKYFQEQLDASSERLKGAEQELLEFNKGNKIMNYYEQTKHIASEREHFELEYQKVQIRFYAAKAVIDKLEEKLSTHSKKKLSSEKVLAIRNEIAKLNFDISMKTLGIETDSVKIKANEKEVKEKAAKVENLQKQLTSEVDSIYKIDHDISGLATSNILSDWLANTIEYEGTRAQLKVMDQKRLEFERLYEVFAPLGATMKRLERKIDIAEREYLSLLHDLGLAKLRQQNGQMQSELELVEVPYFPIKPEPSKRKILVVVAALMGFVLVTFTILVLEFLDNNINTAARAEDRIELEVASIFPIIKDKHKKINYGYLKNKAVNAISRNIILNQFKEENKKKPQVNMLFSTQDGEGKTFICKYLISKLCELDYKVLHITYDKEDLDVNQSKEYNKLLYKIDDKLYKISEFSEFDTESSEVDYSSYDFVIIELPGIIKHPFPVKLVSNVDDIYLVTRANRAWDEADKNALALFKEATTGPEPRIILNGVKILEMESVIGDIPKKRSRIRKWIKRVVQFKFFTKTNIQ